LQDSYAIDSTKIQYHIDSLYQYKHGDRYKLFPIYVEVSPVGYCNHKCTFCALDFMGYKNTRIPESRLLSLMGELVTSGVKSVMFGGEGEPLLHTGLPEVIAEGYDKGLSLAITTNGIAMDDRYLPVLDCLKWVKVSVNAGTADDYQDIHQCKGSDWTRLWDNIGRATSYIHSQKLKTVLGAQAVVLPDNIDNLDNLARLAKFYGCKYLVLKPYSQHPSSGNKVAVTYDKDTFKILSQIVQEYSGDSFQVIVREEAVESVLSDRTYTQCYAVPYFWAYITSTGKVYGCSAFLNDKRFEYGDINQESWESIWLGAKRQIAQAYMPTHCVKECRKGCRMEQVNRYLHSIYTDHPHVNFI
jgi:cyclic pyranopterin phosphate synthase